MEYPKQGGKCCMNDFSYPKIETLFDRDENFKVTTKLRNSSYGLIKTWQFTEKIDGTNIRMIWEDNKLKFGGRTGNALLPADLIQHLYEIIDINKLKEIFPDTSAIIYGEGYGCFSYCTPITLADESKLAIGTIVNSKEPVEVLSYNFETGGIEPKKAIGIRNSSSENWLYITYKRRFRGGRSTGMLVTPTHQIYTKRDGRIIEATASNLKVGDILFLRGNGISYEKEQLIKGSILGDGSIFDNSFCCQHSDSQKGYYDFKQKILKSEIARIKSVVSGFGSLCTKFTTKTLFLCRQINEQIYDVDGKNVNTEYLNKLHPMALACWYMDDGTLRTFDGGRNANCELCTDAFSEEVVDEIILWFNTHGYECYKTMCNKIYPRVRFTPNGTIALHSTIASFVVPSMKYKLIEPLRTVPSVWDHYINISSSDLCETVITSVEKVYEELDGYKKVCYDLSVEGNHNYFANNVLVHNSGIQKGGAYSKTKQFAVFDVLVDGKWWLNWENTCDIAKKLKLKTVPYLGEFTLEEGILIAKNGFASKLAESNIEAEGIVGRTCETLYDKKFNRMIIKLKTRDF